MNKLLLSLVMLNALSASVCGAAEAELSIVGAGPISPSNAKTVLVIFNQPVDPASAEDPSHFTLNEERVFQDARVDRKATNLVYLTLMPAHRLTPDVEYVLGVKHVIAVQSTEASPRHVTSKFKYCNIESETRYILRCRLPDGAMAVRHHGGTWKEGDKVWIRPYFASYAALGMLDAHEMSPNPEYLETVRRWLQWYVTHMQRDNTVTDYRGAYPSWSSTGDYDASDSYAALFLIVLEKYLTVAQDADFLERIYPYVSRAVQAIDLTAQTDDLTWAKPTYHVKYAMDNAEVWKGLRAAAYIAVKANDVAISNEYASRAARVRNAVRSVLYLGDAQRRYAVGLWEDGTYADGWSKWYPDGMAQAMILGFQLLDPQAPRAERVWDNVTDTFVPGFVPQQATGYFLALAAIRMEEKTHADIGYVMMLKNKMEENWIQEAGYILHIASLTRDLGDERKLPVGGHARHATRPRKDEDRNIRCTHRLPRRCLR